MRVVIAGSSGLIGSALTASLAADGHEVVRLVRRPPNASPASPSPSTAAATAAAAAAQDAHDAPPAREVRWDPAAAHMPTSVFEGAHAVVNLAGAGVGDHRWTHAYRQQIRDSRVFSTATLATAMASLSTPPPVFVAGSAIGYYGETGDTPTDESAPAGSDFLAGICQEWEAAATPAEKAGIRVAHPRFGLVVAKHGGAFGKLLPLAKAGLGGRLGTGKQYWSYISLTDAIRALRHIIETDQLSGPVNVTTPNPTINSEITADIGQALGRPTFAAVPGVALRVALGGFAEGILMSQRIVPPRLLASGFTFAHPTFPDALASALAAHPTTPAPTRTP